MKRIYKIFIIVISALLTLASCQKKEFQISDEHKSDIPQGVFLVDYTATSLTIGWDFIEGATSYTVQLTGLDMNPIKQEWCKTTTEVDYHEFTGLSSNQVFYARVRSNFPYSATSDWVYVANESGEPVLLVAGVGQKPETQFNLLEATSSTLTYEWSFTGNETIDAVSKYNIELFTDAEGEDLVVSWEADGKLSSGRGIFTGIADFPKVRFTFSGLQPKKTYYAKVTNLGLGGLSTEILEGTTTETLAPVATSLASGAVLVSQPFDKLIHGGDIVRCAAGYNAKANTNYRQTWAPATGVNPQDEGDQPVVHFATEFGLWSGDVSDAFREATHLTGWGRSATGDNLSTRPGYLKMGGAGAGATLYTPTIGILPDKPSTVNVSFKAAAYVEKDRVFSGEVEIFALNNSSVDDRNVISDGNIVSLAHVNVSEAIGEFNTYTVTLEGLRKDARIGFNTKNAGSGKTRFLLDDILVTYDGPTVYTKLDTPTDVAFDTENVYANQLTLNWKSVTGASDYTVKYWAEGQESAAIVVENITGISYILENLEANTKYYAQVKACRSEDPSSNSDFSQAVSIKTSEAQIQTEIKLTLINTSESTVTIEWAKAEDVDIVLDNNNLYTIALYKDSACTDLVASWEPSGANKTGTNPFKPGAGLFLRFTFPGLEPSTTYYAKVTDATTNTFSDVLECKTAAALPAAVKSNAKAGDVIVSEGFAGLVAGGDMAYFAAGPTHINTAEMRASYTKPLGTTPAGWAVGRCTTGEFSIFSGGGVTPEYTAGTGLGDWGEEKRANSRPGYVKFGSGSDNGGMYTPELSALSGTSKIKVKFSAKGYTEKLDSHEGGKIRISAVDGTTMGAKNKISDGTVIQSHDVDISAAADWTVYEVELENVTPTTRVYIGTVTKRAFLDNVIITVVSVNP